MVAAEARTGCTLKDLQAQIKDAFVLGIQQHKIQTIPHLVLLDEEFYATRIAHLMARWVMVYMHRNLTKDLTLSLSNEDALLYIEGPKIGATDAEHARYVAVKADITAHVAEPDEQPVEAAVAAAAVSAPVSREPSVVAEPEITANQLQMMEFFNLDLDQAKIALGACDDNMQAAGEWWSNHGSWGDNDWANYAHLAQSGAAPAAPAAIPEAAPPECAEFAPAVTFVQSRKRQVMPVTAAAHCRCC